MTVKKRPLNIIFQVKDVIKEKANSKYRNLSEVKKKQRENILKVVAKR